MKSNSKKYFTKETVKSKSSFRSIKKNVADSSDKKSYNKKKNSFSRKRNNKTFSNTEYTDEVRLNKFIANAGICSRREADELIKAGSISVNGRIVTELGTKVKPTDVVKYDNLPIKTEKLVYILLNKPKDYITTVEDPQGRKTVLSLIEGSCKERVYPVGRLDRSTTGLLLLTNDGELAKKLTHPRYEKKKIYHVALDKPLKKIDMKAITQGVELEDGLIKADAMDYVVGTTSKKEVGIELHSGKNRIVRRIFEHLGYVVKKLDRVYFAGLTKKNLPRGRWRFLTEKEVNLLKMS